MVILGGGEVLATDIRTDHDVDKPVATGSMTLRTPRPARLEIGVPVDIYAGYDGATRIIFSGRVAAYDINFDDSGGGLRIELEGWSKLLYYAYFEGRGYNGPINLRSYWGGLCYAVGVPRFSSDVTTDTNGKTIFLGDNPDYRGGWVPVGESGSPGQDIDRIVRHFGYRSFDTPMGARLQRISGLPTESYRNLVRYTEGVNVLSISRTESDEDMVNVVDVRGAEYQAPDTSEVAIRSFTGTYTPNERFGVTGVSTLERKDDIFGSEALAKAARNAYEIDRSNDQWRYQWTATGDPDRIPGEQVAIQGARVNSSDTTDLIDQIIGLLPRAVWLMRVSHLITDRGWTTSMEGWAGLGTPLPAGNDCTTVQILGQQGVHIGNEYLWHYRNPNPAGTQHDIPFTAPENYTTATIRYLGHGTNSFVQNTESTASRFEIIHVATGERTASGEMPRLNENLEKRHPYADGRVTFHDGSTSTNINYFWDNGVVALTGTIKAGANIFRIIAGEDREVGDVDDYEICNATLTYCGIGVPVPLS